MKTVPDTYQLTKKSSCLRDFEYLSEDFQGNILNPLKTIFWRSFLYQVAGMYQDPSIGKIKIYYVVTKIIHIKSTEEKVQYNKLERCVVKNNKVGN